MIIIYFVYVINKPYNMKVLVIDNYDSFTFNLVQILGSLNCKVLVRRNDEITVPDIIKINPDKILISPGPGKPENSKLLVIVVKEFCEKKPILGVCLGHQIIAIAFGGKVIKSSKLSHGKTVLVKHDNKSIFKNVKQNFRATLYHSLAVEKKSLPKCLKITAVADNGTIMGIRHQELLVEGIQFHPESILTDAGKTLIKNWIEI